MTELTGLYPKLLVAQKAAHAVGKKGENVQQHYKYARAEDVITEARKALHSAGLIAWLAQGESGEAEVESKQGTAGILVTLRAELRIADPETGEVLAIPTLGAGIDYPGDKAIYKAMTGAAKYAYASALGIPFGDDPEDESTDMARSSRGEDGKPLAMSPKQVDFLESLLKKKLSADDTQTVMAWATQTLTGGREGTASKAIDAAKADPKPLLNAAQQWQAGQTDLPVDETDLPDPADLEQEPLA